MEILKRKLNIVSKIEINDTTISNNKIDKEVQRMLLPLNLLQILTLNPKYHIKNNFINPNNSFNKLILISGAVTYLTTYTYRIIEILLDDNFRRYGNIGFMVFASIFDFISRFMGFIMNVIMNFMQTKKNVLFVLHFQEVHRFLKNEARLKRVIMTSWISVALIFGFYVIILTYVYVLFRKPPWNVMFYLLFVLSLDSNLIYAIRSIKLLTDKVELWNIQLLLVQKHGCSSQQSTGMFQAFDQILKCYNIMKSIYQPSILYQTSETLFQGWVNVQLSIDTFKYGMKLEEHGYPLATIFLSFWMVKNLIIQMSLSQQLEGFYEAIKDSQNSCQFILASNYRDDDRTKLCKKIVRVHRASFSKMGVFGLFSIDVCHPLRMLALLTHYTVVLLQFAFL